MKIEITKKHLIISISLILLVGLSFTIGYYTGYRKVMASIQNPIGDGSHFYVERFDNERDSYINFKAIDLLYHSTLDCHNIHKGVEMDEFGLYWDFSTPKKVPYKYCPKCMTDVLINICERRIKTAYPDGIID